MNRENIKEYIKATFTSIKDKFCELIQKLCDFVSENLRLSIIVLSLFFSIFLCLILIISINSNDKKNKQTNIRQELILTENLQIPPSPSLPRDYAITREPNKIWEDEDINQWFTIPSDKELDSLSKTNQNIIEEVLGAAP